MKIFSNKIIYQKHDFHAAKYYFQVENFFDLFLYAKTIDPKDRSLSYTLSSLLILR